MDGWLGPQTDLCQCDPCSSDLLFRLNIYAFCSVVWGPAKFATPAQVPSCPLNDSIYLESSIQIWTFNAAAREIKYIFIEMCP